MLNFSALTKGEGGHARETYLFQHCLCAACGSLHNPSAT